jgi:hypothetical protein
MSFFTIVLRVLWNGGVARIAVEESRVTKAKLLVLSALLISSIYFISMI